MRVNQCQFAIYWWIRRNKNVIAGRLISMWNNHSLKNDLHFSTAIKSTHFMINAHKTHTKKLYQNRNEMLIIRHSTFGARLHFYCFIVFIFHFYFARLPTLLRSFSFTLSAIFCLFVFKLPSILCLILKTVNTRAK